MLHLEKTSLDLFTINRMGTVFITSKMLALAAISIILATIKIPYLHQLTSLRGIPTQSMESCLLLRIISSITKKETTIIMWTVRERIVAMRDQSKVDYISKRI